MCTIVFAWRCHPDYPLLLVSNRDEFHDRPAAPAGWWSDAAGVLGGRDLAEGGTWLAVDRGARLAAVTNYREVEPAPGGRSRGLLVADYLAGDREPEAFARDVLACGGEHAGFNMLLAGPQDVVYVSNRADGVRSLPPGVYGLSNHLLDTPWPKVRAGRRRLRALLDAPRVSPAELLEVLNDRSVPPDPELPDTGVGLERERLLGASFIVSPDYGTQAATAVRVHAHGAVDFLERSFEPSGRVSEERAFSWPAPVG